MCTTLRMCFPRVRRAPADEPLIDSDISNAATLTSFISLQKQTLFPEIEKMVSHVSSTTIEAASTLVRESNKNILTLIDRLSGELGRLQSELASVKEQLGEVTAPAARGEGRNMPCKFFARGTCTRGESCPFTHSLPLWEEDAPPRGDVSRLGGDEGRRKYDGLVVAADDADFFEVEDDDCFLTGMVAYARLTGLSRTCLNGSVGQVLGYDTDKDRWKVLPHGDAAPKLFKRVNLMRYEPSDQDVCAACQDMINLSACPRCSCG